MELRELSDRQEITDLITAYTRAVDTGAYADLYEVFTADAELDYTPTGGPLGPPTEVIPWIERGLAGFTRVQHVVGQVAIAFTGPDEATATAYFTNPMVATAPDGTESLWEVGGYYHHRLVRTAAGWRSAAIRDDVVWTRGF